MTHLVRADGYRCRLVRTARPGAQRAFQEAGLVAVEQMTQQATIEVGGSEQPVGNREGEIHVHFHHKPGIVMRRVMTSQAVHEGTVPDEPALLDMTAEVHELVHQIHPGGYAHE